MATRAHSLSQRLVVIPNEDDIRDLAKKRQNCQPVGSHPEYSVIAAKRRFLWAVDVLRSENCPSGTVEDSLKKSIRKEGQFIGICCPEAQILTKRAYLQMMLHKV